MALTVHRAARPGDAAGNLQAWARDVRYAAATEAAGDGLVAVGHTASDQAETVLYRLAASPGRRALLGMRPRSGRLVRPLLTVTREETGAWCRARGLAWRDDATNASGDFARGRVRHGLLAALEAVDPRAAANVVRTAELLREEAEVLDVVVDTTLAGRDRIALLYLADLPPALARLIVRRLAEAATGGLCARAATRLDAILALARGRRAGRRRRRAGGGGGRGAAVRADAAAARILLGPVPQRGDAARAQEHLGALGQPHRGRPGWRVVHAGRQLGRLGRGRGHDLRALQDVARLGVDDHPQLGAEVRQAQRDADPFAPGRVGHLAQRSGRRGGCRAGRTAPHAGRS